MNSFYNLIDTIKGKLEESDFNNKVTFGDITDVDLEKQTSFPLAHIIVDRATVSERTISFDITLVCMDIVNVSKEEGYDKEFYGNDNVQDILNTQLGVITTVIAHLRRLDLNNNNFLRIERDVAAEPFLERFENELAGWESTMTITAINDSSIC
jgi:hypothetical protein